MPQPRLEFAHQDGKLGFRVTEALFAVSKGQLSLALECAENRRHEAMSTPHFGAFNLPCGRAPKLGQVFEIATRFEPGEPVDGPRAHVYAGEHFQPWATRLQVMGVEDGTLAVRGTFVVEDVLYVNKKAKDTPGSFYAVFAKSRKSLLWAPFF